MEEQETLIFKSIDENVLRSELTKYNLVLDYISITKNLKSLSESMCLRMHCNDKNIYYVFLDGKSNFLTSDQVNCLLVNILDEKNRCYYYKYLIALESEKIEFYDSKIIDSKQKIKSLKKEVKDTCKSIS